MKNFPVLILTLMLAAFSFLPAQAQDMEVLSKFEIQKGETHAIVDWTIRAGYGCKVFQVEHSTDGVNFNVIYTYPGFCSADSTDKPYYYLHQNPKKGVTNYYRLNLGEFGRSGVESFYVFNPKAEGYTISPMPATSQSVLYFKNPSQTPFSLRISDMKGRVVYAKEGITGSRIAIREAALVKGAYFFTLTGGAEKHSGRIIQE